MLFRPACIVRILGAEVEEKSQFARPRNREHDVILAVQRADYRDSSQKNT